MGDKAKPPVCRIPAALLSVALAMPSSEHRDPLAQN